MSAVGIANEPPPTVEEPLEPIFFDLSRPELEKAGFQGVHVGCPQGRGNAVIVRYDGGPDLTSPGVADPIAQIVWANEFNTFDLLAIESGGATAAYSYADLTQKFGPQPNTTVGTVKELCGVAVRQTDASPDKEVFVGGALLMLGLGFLGIVVLLAWLSVVVPERIANAGCASEAAAVATGPYAADRGSRAAGRAHGHRARRGARDR